MSEAKKTLTLPVIPGEDGTVECCLNGVNYNIQRGKKVSVPAGVYEILQHSSILAGEEQ